MNPHPDIILKLTIVFKSWTAYLKKNCDKLFHPWVHGPHCEKAFNLFPLFSKQWKLIIMVVKH